MLRLLLVFMGFAMLFTFMFVRVPTLLIPGAAILFACLYYVVPMASYYWVLCRSDLFRHSSSALRHSAFAVIGIGLTVLTVATAALFSLPFDRHRNPDASPNKPAAGNAGFAPQLAIVRHWPGVPEPER